MGWGLSSTTHIHKILKYHSIIIVSNSYDHSMFIFIVSNSYVMGTIFQVFQSNMIALCEKNYNKKKFTTKTIVLDLILYPRVYIDV